MLFAMYVVTKDYTEEPLTHNSISTCLPATFCFPYACCLSLLCWLARKTAATAALLGITVRPLCIRNLLLSRLHRWFTPHSRSIPIPITMAAAQCRPLGATVPTPMSTSPGRRTLRSQALLVVAIRSYVRVATPSRKTRRVTQGSMLVSPLVWLWFSDCCALPLSCIGVFTERRLPKSSTCLQQAAVTRPRRLL